MTSSNLSTLSSNLDTLQAEHAQIETIDASITNKQVELLAVQQRRREGGPNPTTDQQLATVESELAVLRAQRQAIIDSIRQDILDFIESNRGAITADDVEAMFTNEKRDVPAHFKVLTMSETEWETLHRALKHRDHLAITGGQLRDHLG